MGNMKKQENKYISYVKKQNNCKKKKKKLRNPSIIFLLLTFNNFC